VGEGASPLPLPQAASVAASAVRAISLAEVDRV